MRSSPSPAAVRDPMVDGISIRVRVRRASCKTKLEYGEPVDMVCAIVRGEAATKRKSGSSASSRSSFASTFRSSQKTDATLFFQTRTYPGRTLETCCSLHSVSSYEDSLDPSIMSAEEKEPPLELSSHSHRLTCSTNTYPIRNTSNNRHSLYSNESQQTKRRKTYSLPCSTIKSIEMVSSLFRGYRVFFGTETRGYYELEFENKNGMDIMMAFLQATLPPDRFINLIDSGGSHSKDASDTASYLSQLDMEKLTERLAERGPSETMSERLRRSVGQVVSSIEEMSNSFCGNVCCHGQLLGNSSVAPYIPPDEIRDSPPSPPANNRTTNHFDNGGAYQGPQFMEIDEEKSLQGDANNKKDLDEALNKRLYLRDYKLPSGLSVEMPE